MRHRRYLVRKLFGVGILLCGSALAAGDDRVERLTPEHRKWLEEEVVYIITDTEREAFLSIETLEPRERFIEAFWSKRDPNRATVENEFRVEHYRRIDYANEYLGRETSIPGWKTDRGRYYIILGEPQSRQNFDGYQALVSIELWLYQGDTSAGLPPFFNLLFFKPRDVGAYRLYRPIADGPKALLQATFDIGPDPGPALQIIYRESHELARASLSFDASETVDFTNARPSLSSDVVLSRIEALPERAVRAGYADAFLRYGDRVSAEYSFNYIPNDTVSAALLGPEGSTFVHFAIEIAPEDFTIETDEAQSRFTTTLDMDIEARETTEGRLVFAASREIGIELSPSQFERARRAPYSIQDAFPLVPGSYNVSVTLRNRVQTRFTVAEWNVDVPGEDAAPTLSDLVIGYEEEHEDDEPGRGRPFRAGTVRINPASGDTLALHESVHALIQARGAGPGHRVRFGLDLDGAVVDTREVTLDASADETIVQEFPLVGAETGRYRLTAVLVDESGRAVATRTTDVNVSPRTAIARPAFIYRRPFDRSRGAIALAEGEQLWKLGRTDDARRHLEAAAAADPPVPEARWQLAALLIGTGDTGRALALLSPLENDFPNRFEVVAGLGLAHYFEESYPEATDYLERAIALRPPEPPLLNALGDSYQRLGSLAEARESYERSLALDPEQAEIRRRLDALNDAVTAK